MSTLLRLGFLAYYQSTVSSIDFASRSGNLRLGCLRGVLGCSRIIVLWHHNFHLILIEFNSTRMKWMFLEADYFNSKNLQPAWIWIDSWLEPESQHLWGWGGISTAPIVCQEFSICHGEALTKVFNVSIHQQCPHLQRNARKLRHPVPAGSITDGNEQTKTPHHDRQLAILSFPFRWVSRSCNMGAPFSVTTFSILIDKTEPGNWHKSCFESASATYLPPSSAILEL